MHILSTWALLLILVASSMVKAEPVSGQQQSSTAEVPMPRTTRPVMSKVELAAAWSLSLDEYERYLELKVFDSAFSDASISPLEVLGKYASGADQKRYARLYTELYQDNLQRTMSWLIALNAQATNQSALDRYDASPAIQQALASTGVTRADVNTHTSNRSASSSLPTADVQRVRLFLPPECNRQCTERFQHLSLQQSLGRYAGIDVVFAETTSTDADLKRIRQWASEQRIAVDDVRARTITLNHDSENYRQLRGETSLPAAITWDGRTVR